MSLPIHCHFRNGDGETRTHLTKWFLAIYLITHDKSGVSAIRLSKKLEVSYKTAWLMLHKIRQSMKNVMQNTR
jgi:hypothetical protein